MAYIMGNPKPFAKFLQDCDIKAQYTMSNNFMAYQIEEVNFITFKAYMM